MSIKLQLALQHVSYNTTQHRHQLSLAILQVQHQKKIMAQWITQKRDITFQLC